MSEPTTTSRESAPPDRSGPRGSLEAIFSPRAVAVIGATEKAGSVGRNILWNLISSPFGGTVYPVNAKRASVLGIKAYPGRGDSGTSRPGRHRDAGQHRRGAGPRVRDAGVKGAIVISAGFGDRARGRRTRAPGGGGGAARPASA